VFRYKGLLIAIHYQTAG